MKYSPNVFFARSQLLNLHQNFVYPYTEKFFNPLWRAQPEGAKAGTLKTF